MDKQLPKSFFDLIEQSDLPILVDFWAPWCEPCKTVSPSIERIARGLKEKITVIKINVDEKGHIAKKYDIRGIPTIMMFFKGNVLMRMTGAHPYESIKQEIMSKLSMA